MTDQQTNGAACGSDSGSHDQIGTPDEGGATADVTPPTDQEKMFSLCLLHGGMDTEGEVFDDVLVINFES